MRKILFTICILFVCVITSRAQEDSYKIKGQLENTVNGRLMLVAHTEQGMIDIADVGVVNGNFEFTGRMPEPTIAYLMPVQKNGVLAIIILENAPYTITPGTNELIVEGGGEAQKVWKEFQDLSNYLTQTHQQMEAQARASKNSGIVASLQQKLLKIAADVQVQEVELIKKHNNSIATAYMIASKVQLWDEVKLAERYALLGEDAKATFFGKQIGSQLEKLQRIAIDAVAPEFSAPLADGGVCSLHETKAKVKIVNFWSSTCGPCRQENVNLLQIYKRFRPKGLEIIGFSLDNNKHAWLAALGQDGCNWINVSDLKGVNSDIAAKYSVTATPSIFILDENNRIVAKNLRGKELEKKINELLKKKK